MTALIALLKAAECGSRELDQSVAQHIRWGRANFTGTETVHIDSDGRFLARPPSWTTSLDAALTLVPKGAVWSVHSLPVRAYISMDADPPWRVQADGNTPPLALCISALNAKLEMTAMEIELLPCPFCGGLAEHGEIVPPHRDQGGHFIQCANNACGASTNLRFACGDDPKPLLAEQWNRRR